MVTDNRTRHGVSFLAARGLTIRTVVGAGMLLAAATVSTNAAAAPVDNPGTFTLYRTDNAPFIDLPSGIELGAAVDGTSLSITLDLDSAGDIDPSSVFASFPSQVVDIPNLGVSNVQFIPASGGVTGNLDASTGVVAISLRGRLRISHGATICLTGIFTAPTANYAPPVPNGAIHDVTTFGTAIIPVVPATTSCPSAVASFVNLALGLNGSAASTVWFYKTFVTPDIHGS